MKNRVAMELLLVAFGIGLFALHGSKSQQVPTQGEPKHSVFCNSSRPHYCPNHIACKTKWSSACGSKNPIPSTISELIVDVHNECRDRATRIKPHDWPERVNVYPRLGNLPSSAALMQLNWDEELSDMADLWVVSCAAEAEAYNGTANIAKDPPPRVGKPYQTLFYTGKKTLVPRYEFCFDVSRFKVNGWLWISRGGQRQSMSAIWRNLLWAFCSNVSRSLPQYIIETYRPPEESLGAYYREEGVCMLWASSARLGCAQRLRGADDSTTLQFEVLACLYGPAPLQRGERVYEVGEAGSACPPQAPAAAARWPHLCIPQGSMWAVSPVAVPICIFIVLAVSSFFIASTF